MRYIKVVDNTPIEYSIEQLLIDIPDAVIYKKTQKPNEKLLANYNVYPLITTEKPFVHDGETLVEGTPQFKDGEWQQTWSKRDRTQEEMDKIISEETIIIDRAIDEDLDTVGFFVPREVSTQRYDICQSCDQLRAIKVCKLCNCIMPIKTRLSDAECPLEKW